MKSSSRSKFVLAVVTAEGLAAGALLNFRNLKSFMSSVE
jgi:hypothetical protein